MKVVIYVFFDDDDFSPVDANNMDSIQLRDMMDKIDYHVEKLQESIDSLMATKDYLQDLRNEYFSVYYDKYCCD